MKKGRTEGRLSNEKSCNTICTYIFAYKFCSLYGTIVQCYHIEQNLRTDTHNCISLSAYLCFDSVLKRRNRKAGWPITAPELFLKTLSYCNKSKDIMQMKLFLSELSDLTSLCPIPVGCLKYCKRVVFENRKGLCFNLDLFKLQCILLY